MGTVYHLNPSEMQRHENVGFLRVDPVLVRTLQTTAPPPPPTVRPVKSICKNLFGGGPGVGEIDKKLFTQQRKQIEYVRERYNIDLGESCNQPTNQISISDKQHNGAASLYARGPQGLKRTYQVRKANTAISNVPKRIRDDNLSSEKKGQAEKVKEKEREREEEQKESEKQKESESKEKEKEAVAETPTQTQQKKEEKEKTSVQQQQKEQQENGEEAEDK